MNDYEEYDYEAIALEARNLRLELEAQFDRRGQRIAD